MKLKLGILMILAIFLITNIVSAGVNLVITPVDSESTVPGGIIRYTVTLTPDESGLGSPWEDEYFSVDDPMESWNYIFNPANFRIYETDTSRSSILTISVPPDAQPGIYSHTVSVSGYDETGQIIGIATEVRTEIFDVPVAPVPELGSTKLILVGLFGMVLISRKYGANKTENNS